MGVSINPNHISRRVALTAIAERRARITLELTPDEARRIAAELTHYATAVEPYQARLDLGAVAVVEVATGEA